MKLHHLLVVALVALGLALPAAAQAKPPKKVPLQCKVLGPHKVKVTNPGKLPIPKTATIVVRKGATGPVILKWKLQPHKVCSPRDAITLQLQGPGIKLDGHGGDLAGKPGQCEAFAKVPAPK
jgi:hypothetical protein